MFILAILTIIVLCRFVKNCELKFESVCFSKDWTYGLKGYLAWFVVFHHIGTNIKYWDTNNIAIDGMLPTLFFYFGPWGEWCVGIFFFITGYGLYKSYQTKGEKYMKGFICCHMKKILPCFLLLTCLEKIALYFVNPVYNVWSDFKEAVVSGRNFFIWYIMVLVAFYIFFKFSFKVHNGMKAIYIVLALTIALSAFFGFIGYGDWWWKSNLCFPLGVLYAEKEQAVVKILKDKNGKIQLLLYVGLLALCALSNMGGKRYIIKFITPLLPFAFVWCSYMVNFPKTKIMSFFSDISYELFISHMVVISVVSLLPCSIYAKVLMILTVSPMLAFATKRILLNASMDIRL